MSISGLPDSLKTGGVLAPPRTVGESEAGEGGCSQLVPGSFLVLEDRVGWNAGEGWRAGYFRRRVTHDTVLNSPGRVSFRTLFLFNVFREGEGPCAGIEEEGGVLDGM